MGTWRHRIRVALLWLARMAVVLVGFWYLYKWNLLAFGGKEKLWLFEKMEAHRYTAMSMLTGTLKLRNGLSKLGHDEQIYNGAVYTNWSFGVPLLQVPFHAAAAKMKSLPQKFFPDRAIYFSYFMAMTPILWAAFDRLLAMREAHGASKLQRHCLSWAGTVFVLVTAFYPLMSCRFIVYEEGICYFMVAELLALSAYIFALRSWSSWAVAGIGAAAGIGLLVRPTGLIYVGIWGLLLLLERRRLRTLLAFGGSLAPFAAFWLVSNWVKTGSPLGLGMNNSMPWLDYQTPIWRFGSLCTNTPTHAAETAIRLFRTFFAYVAEESKDFPWLDQCHLRFEDRPPPVGIGYGLEPFFGPIVLAALVWMVLHQLKRRESRLAFYVPVAGFVLIFATFAMAGVGFAWRYAGDFWPVLALAGVQYIRFLPRRTYQFFAVPLALSLLASAYATHLRLVEPSVTTIETLDEYSANSMWDDFSNSRWVQDKPLATHFRCGDHLADFYHSGQGWMPGCRVDTFTNLFIGVPYKTDNHYQLLFKTEGVTVPFLRVYLNGRLYGARRMGDSYIADVFIHYDRLTSPIVLTTIEWTREFEAPPYKLQSVELM
jgi:hypothetical protein